MNEKGLPSYGVRWNLLFRPMWLALLVFLLSGLAVQAQTATVTTDKDDYAPGEYVIITGTGWLPGERVDFHFQETPKPATCVNSHDNYATADANGNIYYDGFLIKINHLGVSFVLTATGQSSGRIAVTEFTDAINTVISLSSPATASQGSSVVISATLTQSNGPNAGAAISGASISFNLNSISIGTANTNSAGVASINYIVTAPIGVYNGSSGIKADFAAWSDFNKTSQQNSIEITASTCTAPTISIDPVIQIKTYGENASFTIVASGTATLGYQWQQLTTAAGATFLNISGATSATLNLALPSFAMNGYQYRCVVTNTCGTVNSNSATLSVNKKALTAPTTVASKVYDGSAVTGTVTLGAVTGLVGSETLVITPTATNYADANAGTNKSTTISYSLSNGTGNANNYSMANLVTSGNITKAPSVTTVTIAGAPFTYTGAAHTPATVTVTGAGGLNLTPTAAYANNVNAGTATASYSYAGDDNYLTSSDSKDFAIGKAATTTTITIAGAPFTYTGAAHTPATVTVTGAGGLNLTPTAAYANNVNAGTATASYSYAGDDNYLTSSDSKDFAIGKAATTTTITIAGAPFTYTGAAHTPATVTVTGAGGLNLTPTAAYANNVNAGTATASYSYAGDDNYLTSSDSKDFAIGKAATTTTITIAGAPFTYTGAAHTPATVTVTGAGGLNLTPTAAYANNVNAGTATASYSYAGDDNYLTSSDSKDFAIGKAATTTTITIAGAPFTYTGAAHTPATVTVTGAGGLNLTPTAAYANNVNAGTATASYSYAGDDNYLTSSDSKDFAIGKAATTTTITIAGAPFTYTGAAHTPATVTVTGAGGLNLTPTAAYANNVNAGTATASYSYAGDDNYLTSSDSKDFAIGKAATTTTITIAGAPFTYTGAAHTPATVTVTGAGGLNLTPTAAYANNVNAGTATASYSYAGDDNYLTSSDSKDFAIGKAATTTTITIAGAPFTYTGAAHTPATVTVTGAGGLNLTPTAAYANNVNAGTATASYSYAGDDNYLTSSDSKDFAIGKAATTTTITIAGAPFTYTGAAHTPATVTVTGAGGLNLTPTAAYANNVNAGTATASYSYAGDDNYLTSSDSKDFAIGKAATTTTITIAGAPFTYTGAAHTPATVTVTGAGGLNLTPTAAYANNVNAGTATASYSYAGDDNYLTSSDSKDFAIGKAATTTTITIAGAPFTYTGAAHTPATVTVTGAGGLNLTPTAAYANNVNAGTATASYSYAGDDNYLTSSDSKDFAIGKAILTYVANTEVKPYGNENPILSGGVTGFVAGENLNNATTGTAMWNTTATQFSNVDNYSITGSGLTAINGNYTFAQHANNATAFTINKRPLNITGSKVYDGNGTVNAADLAAGNLVNSDVVTLGGNATVASKNVNSYNSLISNLLTSSNSNYKVTDGAVSISITQRPLTVSATGVNKVYDGNTAATVNLSSDKVSADVINLAYASATLADPNVGTNIAVDVTGISISGTDAANYNLLNTIASTTANITKANTLTTLITSAGKLRFMDELTLTAVVKPVTGAGVTGAVQFKVNGVEFGDPIPVTNIPGDLENKVQATLIKQVNKMPSTTAYNVTAEFITTSPAGISLASISPNYNPSTSSSVSLMVDPRSITPYSSKGFYTGDLFVWTTSSSSSKATITLVATVKDVNNPSGDVRAAKVTFYTVSSTNVLTPIPSAKDLPVGLVDINDGSVGFASAIAQFDIGSQNALEYRIAVGISGAYSNDPKDLCAQKTVTIAKPIPGGFIVGGGDLKNQTSAGYIKGVENGYTDFEFDISYTKSGSNPKGKSSVYVHSYYKSDGTLDSNLHLYNIQSTAISTLAITQNYSGAIGDFSSKANLYEILPNGTPVQIEGGSTFQMQVFQKCGQKEVAITLYRKQGGIWFSSRWILNKTERQSIDQGEVRVAGGEVGCAVTARIANPTTAPTPASTQPVAAQFDSYPNPFSKVATFRFALEREQQYELAVYDIRGILIKKVSAGSAEAGKLYEFNLDGQYLSYGVYFARLITQDGVKTLRIVKE